MSAPARVNKTILIIDDDSGIVDGLVTLLEDEGHQVAHAGNGLEGLNYLENNCSIDLILLDLMMPVMEGHAFREELLKRNDIAQIPVIVLTAGSQQPERLAQMNVTATLKKPIDIDHLLDIINSI